MSRSLLCAKPPLMERTGWLVNSKRNLPCSKTLAMPSKVYNHPSKKQLRKILREAHITPEAVLWNSLKNRQLLGKKFRRQISIGPYIVDFYCPECRLVVELDGAAHFSITRNEYGGEEDQIPRGAGANRHPV